MAIKAIKVPSWAKNKKALAGVGVAAALGAVVLLKRGKSGGGSAGGGGAADTSTVPTGSGAAGAYDSTSGDIANQLGQYQTGLQTALGQSNADQKAALASYQDQLSTSLKGLTAGQPKLPTYTYTPVRPGDTWYSEAAKYGTSVTGLLALNPALRRDPQHAKQTLQPGQTLRVG